MHCMVGETQNSNKIRLDKNRRKIKKLGLHNFSLYIRNHIICSLHLKNKFKKCLNSIIEQIFLPLIVYTMYTAENELIRVLLSTLY